MNGKGHGMSDTKDGPKRIGSKSQMGRSLLKTPRNVSSVARGNRPDLPHLKPQSMKLEVLWF